jgi:hypothetical protein
MVGDQIWPIEEVVSVLWGSHAIHERLQGMLWLASRRWWLLAGALVILILSVVLSISVVSIIPVGVVVFLLFFSLLMTLVARGATPRPPGPH